MLFCKKKRISMGNLQLFSGTGQWCPISLTFNLNIFMVYINKIKK